MKVKPISLKEANQYVAEMHRHNKPVTGHKFSIQAINKGKTVGVAIVGRPIARGLDDSNTVEILRVCTDGTRNACSFLYGACCRIAKELGYEKVVTYTLSSEPGTSPKAAGFKTAGNVVGRSWNCPSRPRTVIQNTLFGSEVKYATENKVRWEKHL